MISNTPDDAGGEIDGVLRKRRSVAARSRAADRGLSVRPRARTQLKASAHPAGKAVLTGTRRSSGGHGASQLLPPCSPEATVPMPTPRSKRSADSRTYRQGKAIYIDSGSRSPTDSVVRRGVRRLEAFEANRRRGYPKKSGVRTGTREGVVRPSSSGRHRTIGGVDRTGVGERMRSSSDTAVPCSRLAGSTRARPVHVWHDATQCIPEDHGLIGANAPARDLVKFRSIYGTTPVW